MSDLDAQKRITKQMRKNRVIPGWWLIVGYSLSLALFVAGTAIRLNS